MLRAHSDLVRFLADDTSALRPKLLNAFRDLLAEAEATATAAFLRGLLGSGAGRLEEDIRDLYESWPSAAVLPTVDPTPLDFIAG